MTDKRRLSDPAQVPARDVDIEVEPAALLELALAVVRPAARLARGMRAEGVGEVATKSTDTDVVTAADRAVERQVVAALREARPHDRVLGEEFGAGGPSSTDARRSTVRWVLDPIDGTVNYLYNLPVYAVSLAAEVDGTVVAGVVCNAATGQEWTATLGGGAYTRQRRLTGSAQTRLGQALVATGFAYDPARRAHQAAVLAGLLPNVRDIRRFGSASLDLCMAAEGSVDAYYEQGLNRWDHAAGGLVAAEAGLLVTGLAGAPPGPDLVMAAPPALHGPLHDCLVALDAAGGH
jgi:myo-inositol-1(or 4)-monophosphatase